VASIRGTVLLKGMESYTVLPVKLGGADESVAVPGCGAGCLPSGGATPWPGSAFLLAAFLVQANN